MTQGMYVDVPTVDHLAGRFSAPLPGGTRGFAGTPIDDSRLAAELIARRPSTLMQIYDRLAASVYAVALRLVGEVPTAERMVEDAFLALWRSPGEVLVRRQSLSAFLCGTVCSKPPSSLSVSIRQGEKGDACGRRNERSGADRE